MARITVVIPTFNRSSYLIEVMDSVLSQSYRDFELLVSDNASTDDTADVIGRYDDPRIRYVRRDENIGWVRNFNAALASVETEYVQVLNDDDLMLPGALERAMAALDAEPGVGMLHTAHDVMDESGDVVARNVTWTEGLKADTLEKGNEFIFRSMECFGRTCSPTVVMRTAALPSVPFDPADEPNSDHSLGLFIALDWDVQYLATPGVIWREHESQDSASWGALAPNGTYARRADVIMVMRDVKLRFLQLHADRLPNERALHHAVRRFTDGELLQRVRASLDGGRHRALRELADGARRSPTLMFRLGAWRLLLRIVVGRRLLSALRGLRPR